MRAGRCSQAACSLTRSTTPRTKATNAAARCQTVRRALAACDTIAGAETAPFLPCMHALPHALAGRLQRPSAFRVVPCCPVRHCPYPSQHAFARAHAHVFILSGAFIAIWNEPGLAAGTRGTGHGEREVWGGRGAAHRAVGSDSGRLHMARTREGPRRNNYVRLEARRCVHARGTTAYKTLSIR